MAILGWLAWNSARHGGWLGYLTAIAALFLPTAMAIPGLNGSAGAGNFGLDLFILAVVFPSIPVAVIAGGFGVAKWRATKQWKARHEGAHEPQQHR